MANVAVTMSILGNRVVRREDPKFLTVGGTYVDDIDLPGALHVHYVRSTMAHAVITSVDVDEAKAAPGVVAVFTGADVDLAPLGPPMPGMFTSGMERPWLARDRVRFVGEPVAAIVTEERYQGPDAAELVWVDYDPLPAVVDPATAAESDTLLFPEAGTNVAADLAAMFGERDDPNFFDGCDVVVRQKLVNHRVAPCPMEVRAAASTWEGGRLIHWASTQNPHAVRDELAAAYGLAKEQVRVIAPDVGGGFGAKMAQYTEEQLLPWIAKRVGRPVRWVETRTESMLTLGHGRGQTSVVELGGTRDGTVLALRHKIIQDAGAYPLMGAVLPFMTRQLAAGVYRIPKISVAPVAVVTNTTPTVAYRGAGRPEATYAIERMMDLFAAELGMDPAEVRRKNLITEFPHTTVTGAVYESGDYVKALDLVLEAADYAGLRKEQAERRASGDPVQMGIGVSAYVEITNPMGGEYGGVEITAEGKARIRAGTFSHGQGHETSFAMIVADRLGIDLDDIEFIQGDTDEVRSGKGTGGSRSLQTAGNAVGGASDEVVEKAKRLAADLLEANPDDLVLDTAAGAFHVAGTPTARKTWAELGRAAAERGESLRADYDFEPPGPTFPFGAHVAVVDVDTETGRVRLRRFVAVDDSGRILNPLITEGQRHGGIAQGVAQALLEEVRFDADGNPVTSNLADYGMISAAELPSFELVPMETPTPYNPLGAKGIGESGTIGATPAVVSAVCDALAPFGVRHLDMPTTPEKVWRAVTGRS